MMQKAPPLSGVFCLFGTGGRHPARWVPSRLCTIGTPRQDAYKLFYIYSLNPRLVAGFFVCGMMGKFGLTVKKIVILLLQILTVANSQIQITEAFPNLYFTKPIDLQYPPDGSNRLFVVAQHGYIYVFENDPLVTNKTLFLDISDRIVFEGERGLLGMAFHPEYENNGYFFVNYTAPGPLRSVISRFQVTSNNSDEADEESEFVIIEINQPFENHNGGQIVFGPDGNLYIGMGDGGAGGDPYGHGQNLYSLHGSILRIDVDNPGGELNYGIPDDNPFVGTSYRAEIYAYGLRNPWRFSFDPITNFCWIADVGQDLYEEIDLLEVGGNYGWDIMEGANCYDPAVGCDTAGLILPFYEYSHDVGESITGGFVYRGSLLPELYGKYIFADFEYGDVWSLGYEEGIPLEVSTLGDLGSYSVTSFGVDQHNELYICSFNGMIYKFVQASSSIEDGVLKPNNFSLYQNHPNPFNPITTIRYDLPEDALVNITIYDMMGRVVSNLVSSQQNAGYRSIQWNATNNEGQPVSAGLYLYTIEAGQFRQTKKMVLLK